MIDRKLKEEIEKIVEDSKSKPIHHSQITPKMIKQRHLEDLVIKTGASDRPTDDTTGVKAHFDTSTGVLSIWNGTTWLETTLS